MSEPVREPVHLMLIVPHPDDEVYGAGGTILEYGSSGRPVGLATLTHGEKGRSLGLVPQDELAALRDGELRASVERLGVAHFRQHDYPDGGLSSVDFDEVVNMVASDLLEFAPRAVLTFPPDGSNRHPDHMATNRIVVAALERTGLLERGTSLYYYASSEPFDEEARPGWLPPTHARDVTAHLVPKLEAIACHRSQALSTVDFLRRRAPRIVLETFHRAAPAWRGPDLGVELD